MKLRNPLILLLVLFIFATCKKDSKEDPITSNPTPTPAEVTQIINISNPDPVVQGYLDINTEVLLMRPNENAFINAVVIGNDGSIVIPQPTLIFSTDNPNVANVNSSGNVTVIAQGMATISVSDGIHLTRTISVTVDDSIPINQDPLFIHFTSPDILLTVGNTATINYQVYNLSLIHISEPTRPY